VEPAKTIDSLSEFSLLVNILEGASNVVKESQHVSFNTLRRFLGNLKRSLKKRNREVRVRAG
jgi:hypothetical protein